MSTCLATLIVCTGYINSMHGKMINLWKCFVTFVSCSRAKVQRRILFPSLNFFSEEIEDYKEELQSQNVAYR